MNHATIFSKLTMNLIASRHGKSLRNLQLQNTCGGWADDIDTCHAVSTLHIADLDLSWLNNLVTRLVAQNLSALTSLKLGIESTLLSQSRRGFATIPRGRMLFTNQLAHAIRDEFTSFLHSRDHDNRRTSPPAVILTPKSLYLIGNSFTNHAELGSIRLYDFNNLQSLRLNSCEAGVNPNTPFDLLAAPEGHANFF